MSILEKVLKEFEKIAAIPRPSHREGRVADYLADRLTELGMKVEVDEVGNVIANEAAVPVQGEPLFVLQAHMDMVCVSDGSVEYNPLTDGIKLRREGEYLKAVGTSLGADDGMGIAIILYLLEEHEFSTKVRVIFTVDEESGMSGARGLDEKYLKDATYVINVDSENADEVVIGCAGSMRVGLNRQVKWTAPTMKESLKVKISGLKGGHSGEAIGIKHSNAIKIAGEILKRLNCEIACIEGGRALNVISSEAEAVVVTDRSDVDEVCKAIEGRIRADYEEPKALIEAEKIEFPEKVMSVQEVESLCKLIEKLKDGVYDREASANIGTLKTTEEGVKLEYMPRFHSESGRQIMEKIALEASQAGGFNINFGETSPAWKSEKDRLLKCALEVARKQGRELKVKVIHGGLECSHFMEKNPKLEIISLGTTNLDIHSPKERLLLSSVEPTVMLILGVLRGMTA